jgi:hypothetical protein
MPVLEKRVLGGTMDEKRPEGYEDTLEQEIFELEAFIHAKGLDKQMDNWRRSADYEDDLKSYEQFIKEEAERIDTDTMTMKDEE